MLGASCSNALHDCSVLLVPCCKAHGCLVPCAHLLRCTASCRHAIHTFLCDRCCRAMVWHCAQSEHGSWPNQDLCVLPLLYLRCCGTMRSWRSTAGRYTRYGGYCCTARRSSARRCACVPSCCFWLLLREHSNLNLNYAHVRRECGGGGLLPSLQVHACLLACLWARSVERRRCCAVHLDLQ